MAAASRDWSVGRAAVRAATALALTAAGGAVAAAAEPDLVEREDVLFLAPGGPVVLRVTCRVQGEDAAAGREALAEAIVGLLDPDRDGALTADEARHVPAYGRFGDAARVGDDWARLDESPRDEKLSVREVAAHIAAASPLKLRLAPGMSARAQTLDLHGRLDRNGDGQLSVIELRGAGETLTQCDFDDDGSFSLVELEALRRAATPRTRVAAAWSAATLPFATLGAEHVEDVASLLEARYGEGTRRMSAAEAREFAAHPRPDLELDVRFSGQGAGGLTAREPGSARESGSEDGNGLNSVPRGVRRNQVVDLGGVKVELRAQNTGVLAKLTREYFRDPLRVADGNRNGYVEPAEFAGLDLVNADFGAVDFNENGEIVAAEVSAYVEQELLLQQSTVVISVDNELKSLFEVLDGDSDRRLTPREFLRGAGEFDRLDVNGNRELAESELLTRYRLTFGLGAARLSAQLVPGTAPRSGGRAKAAPLPAAPGSGPLWFRRMDRNRDGDVAWREFLGPREAFARIDADGDGLIDAGEAEGR